MTGSRALAAAAYESRPSSSSEMLLSPAPIFNHSAEPYTGKIVSKSTDGCVDVRRENPHFVPAELLSPPSGALRDGWSAMAAEKARSSSGGGGLHPIHSSPVVPSEPVCIQSKWMVGAVGTENRAHTTLLPPAGAHSLARRRTNST